MVRSFFILSLCAVLALSACKEESAAPAKDVIRPVRAMQIGEAGDFSTRKFPGRAEASNAVTLAFEVPGKLNEIPANVGDQVKKGDVLASLDARDFQNALDQAKAELTRAKAQYGRIKQAAAENAVSKQELSDAEAAYQSAQASVKIQQKALDDTELLAPYDAIIAAKYIKSFGNVQAKQQAIRLVDPSRIEMIGDIPEDIIPYAKEGMEILVEFDAFPGVIITSRVTEIGTEASQTTRTYPVTLIMDQPEDVTILPGMSGKAWRAPQTKPDDVAENLQGHEVPITAIFSGTDGQSYVWVIAPDTGIVTRTLVKTGEMSDDGVLVQGLNGGETIATAGVNHLKDGQQVRILK